MNISVYLGLFFLGSIFGSFLNVLIYRLPEKISLLHPRSFCVSCKHLLKWHENIPIASYVIQRGKCNHCGKSISPRYLLVELLSGLIFILIWIYTQNVLIFIFSAFSALIFLAIMFIDYKNYIIPDKLLVILFLPAVVLYTFHDKYDITHHLLSAGIVFVVLFLLRITSRYVFKKESFGLGDVKLGTIIGFMLGWQAALVAIFFGFLIAGIAIIVLLSLKKIKKGSYIPFGPFIILGMVTYILWGKTIISLYLSLFLH